MSEKKTSFVPVSLSLEDMAGEAYVNAACEARSFLTGEGGLRFAQAGEEVVDFFPESLQERLLGLLPHVGDRVVAEWTGSAAGATTEAFASHSKRGAAPVSGLGYYRIGEDGRLYLTTKCEHYHTPLGHRFPGYGLVERAKELGIPNGTHNNTRGHITRLLEEELVRTAAGIARGDDDGLARLLASESLNDMNRVLNLETGSLAAEAAIKLVLSRFFCPEAGGAEPKYAGRTPVFVVLGDDDGGNSANYHGTTVTAQVLRGMWPSWVEGLRAQGLMEVRSVRPNDLGEFERILAECDEGPYKVAAFFHELVMMNYGATLLSDAFVQGTYAMCAERDIPTVVDEIQTGVWSPEVFMFREYGVKPSMVCLGKGFPGGEYPASRILFSGALDSLSQFGALVTNGQEELASLCYLVTMRWVAANGEVIREVGDYYQERLKELAERYGKWVDVVEGRRHLAGMYFRDLEPAKAFAAYLNSVGMDISVQTYKKGCPPSALTKLPLTAGFEVVDWVVARMDEALGAL